MTIAWWASTKGKSHRLQDQSVGRTHGILGYRAFDTIDDRARNQAADDAGAYCLPEARAGATHVASDTASGLRGIRIVELNLWVQALLQDHDLDRQAGASRVVPWQQAG